MSGGDRLRDDGSDRNIPSQDTISATQRRPRSAQQMRAASWLSYGLRRSLAMAGCGGDGGSRAPATEPGGRQRSGPARPAALRRKLRGCHTLEAASTTGSVGPAPDDTTLDAAAIARQIEVDGGSMRAGLLEGGEKALVAEYVAERPAEP